MLLTSFQKHIIGGLMMSKKKTRKNRFRGKVSKDSQRQKAQASQFGYLNLPKGIQMFQEEPGRVWLDILPYKVTDEKHPDRDDELGIAVPGELWYKRPFKIHRNVGVNNETVVCLTSIGKRCPICEYRAKLRKEGGNEEEVAALRPSRRNLYVVVPKNNKKYDEEPHIWDISQYCFQDLLNDEIEEDEEVAGFPDLEDGLTLKIRFSEEKFGKNTFSMASRIDFIDRDEAYDESILDEVPNLDEILEVLPYKRMEAKFFELDEAEEETEDEEEEDDIPDFSSKRKRRKLKEPEEEEEEEEEEEDKPKQKSGSKPVKAEEEPEEEEEEEPPARRTKRNKKKKTANKCPYGHVFGKDCDEYPDDCDECDLWDECIEASEVD